MTNRQIAASTSWESMKWNDSVSRLVLGRTGSAQVGEIWVEQLKETKAKQKNENDFLCFKKDFADATSSVLLPGNEIFGRILIWSNKKKPNNMF